jgi:sulfite reductase alpha subunit-like flavoprotein
MIELHLALSRSKSSAKYVQHRISDMGKPGADILMNTDTHYYVSGDARMADACFASCVSYSKNIKV